MRWILVGSVVYLLVGVAIAGIAYRIMRDQVLDRYDRLTLISYVFCWPLVVLVLLVDWADWPNITR